MKPVRSRPRGAPTLAWLAVALSASVPAVAEVRGGDTVIVDTDEVIEENLYASGGTVAIRGDVQGDLVVAGGTILVDGIVMGDVLAAGGQISISGRVAGDVRAAGGQVSLLAPTGGDAVVAGGDVHIGAPVGGDALLAGGTAVVTAPVGGGLHSTAGETRVGSSVAGDVVVQGGRLRLEREARVHGDVSFTGPRVLERAPGARIDGVVTQRRAPTGAEPGVGAFLYGWLQILTGLFVLGLVLLLLFRGFSQRAMDTLRARPGKSVGVGALAFLGVPLVVALVFLVGTFVGGAWLGFVGLALYGIALALCVPLIAAFLGLAVVQRLKRSPTASWWPMLLGLVVLTALFFIPVLGPLLALATVLFGLGALVLAWAQTLRQRRRSGGTDPTWYQPTSGTPGPAGAPREK